MQRNESSQLTSAISAVGLLSVWFIAIDCFQVVSPLLVPSFQEVSKTIFQTIVSNELLDNLNATLFRVLIGLLIGVALGVTCGFAVGIVPRLYAALELPIEFLRALPATALFPLFLIIFGLGDSSKIAMVALPTGLVMLINTYYGVKQASQERRKMARVFGANKIQIFMRITFFEALPQIVIGLRLSLSLALVVAVASEMFIGTELGVGQRIFDAYLTSSPRIVYTYILTAGLLGYALNRAVNFLERHFIFWSGR